MKNKISTIRFKSLNCGGISSQTKACVAKRRSIFNSLRNIDISILTETKFKRADLDIYKREWGPGFLASCTSEIRAQAGVALLFRKGLAIDVKSTGSDLKGRVVWALVEINTKTLLIIGVYAPSQGDDPKFFKDEVFPILDDAEYDHVILGGDWNLGMDEDLDYWGYNNTDSVRPNSRRELHRNIEKYELLDVYRELNPDGQEKTWRAWNKSGKKADKEARLDYFIVDTSLASFTQLVGVSGPFTSAFDHRPIILNVDFNKVERGPGYWKFNNAMLDEPEYLDKVRDQIAWTLYEYQRLVSPDSIPIPYSEIKAMTPEEQSKLDLSINPHQFLEFLLFSIKGLSRRYGQNRKTNLTRRKETAEEKLRLETKVHDNLMLKIRTEPPSGDTEEALIICKSNLLVLQKEIRDLETHIHEGAYLRCGAKWKCESEAPSKVFFQCEKWRGQQRYIGIVEVDSEIPGTTRQITSQPEIEATVRAFYENLYRERPTNSSEADIKGFMGDTAYDNFHNIFQKNIPTYTQEKLARDLDSEEVLYAIHNGKHGVAPGISGFSREFYQILGKDLIGFIMNYINFSEEQGILSVNQRVGVITLLPKGTKDKKALKNWRPITLLSTLYKIVSGVIANRFKKALPYVIGLSQKGFVDGRYMGEVTRLLYDTIHDAYSTKGKKGLIMSIDFEKAFDSVSFSFIEEAIRIAGFPKKLRTWVKILLNKFQSHINHAGNLLKLIELGRGARQGDPIASILFVIAIEVLLTTIRSNQAIEPYKFHMSVHDKLIANKVDAYADDVNLTLPRNEASIREVVDTLDRFEKISGLRVNKEKTQMLRIGKGATSDPILCEDLGLQWVERLNILGIKLSANPHEIMENFDEKIVEIEKLLNNFTYRNITVYGRIQVVKTLALSKVTHLVQIIPNPPPALILKLQKLLNNFIWKGGRQKKVVINQELAQQPQTTGGLAIPNLQNFWDSLKLAWLPRLIQADDDCTWKRLALSKISLAMRIPNLTTARLLAEGPDSISKAAKAISNPFWQAVLAKMVPLESAFYNSTDACKIEERVVWDNMAFQQNGLPFSRKANAATLTHNFNCIKNFISTTTNVLMEEHEVKNSLKGSQLQTWNQMVASITTYLTAKNLTWYDIGSSKSGPQHWGWSRLVLENSKSRKFYNLLMKKENDAPRNPNEQKWRDKGLSTMTSERFNKLYKNLRKLKCGLRVKWQEFRIIWGRQELNRYKLNYNNTSGDSKTTCSYCGHYTEDEKHLYIDCHNTEGFWEDAYAWYECAFGVTPPLLLNGPRLFGMENEPPDDLLNIFYRCVRYTIYMGRKRVFYPELGLFTSLVKDELKFKYSGNRILKHADKPSEQRAIAWMRIQMGWVVHKKKTKHPI